MQGDLIQRTERQTSEDIRGYTLPVEYPPESGDLVFHRLSAGTFIESRILIEWLIAVVDKDWH